jgi:hypothetical protein
MITNVNVLNKRYFFQMFPGEFILNNQIDINEHSVKIIELAANEKITLGTIKTNRKVNMFLIFIVI